MKTSRTLKRKLAAWRHDRNLVIFWRHYDTLFVRDGLLYKSLKTKNTHPEPAIVVPKALETEILKGTHDSPFTGHLGVTRTLHRIRKRFFWSNMRESVENYIRQCDICAKEKHPHRRPTMAHPHCKAYKLANHLHFGL